MKKINRVDAVSDICKKKLSTLNYEGRESLILDMWGLNNDHQEFSSLSAELQNIILTNDDPPDDLEKSIYDELIFIALITDFYGVTNTFVTEYMATAGLDEYEVIGQIEKLEVCPCCKYRTLGSRGEYQICGLCNWEDTGLEDESLYSGPNHMTLGEVKKEFIKKMGVLPVTKWERA